MAESLCDVVLEGGGVKGIGLVGALEELELTDHRPCRIAGTSAGAIIGALLAAGMPASSMKLLVETIDYTRFRDESLLDRLGLPGKAASLLFEKGIYEGRYLREWLYQQLDALGVRTFADLKLTESWAKQLPPSQRYKLVVIASDVSRGRLVRLPWDYATYGLDPDKQLVADAVRASIAIPYFYEPVKLRGKYLVDGGLLSNFPIDIFDTTNEWPTFGIKLSAKADAFSKINPTNNVIEYGLAILATATNAHDQMHLDDACTQKRTIFVDTFDIHATNFDITREQQRKLYESGRAAAQKFLKTWDYATYKKMCIKKTRG